MSLPGTIEEFIKCGFAVPESEDVHQLNDISGFKEALIRYYVISHVLINCADGPCIALKQIRLNRRRRIHKFPAVKD